MKYVLVCFFIALQLAVVLSAEKKPMKANFKTQNSDISVVVDNGELNTNDLGPEPKSADSYKHKKAKKGKTVNLDAGDKVIQVTLDNAISAKKETNDEPVGGYMGIKMDEFPFQQPRSKYVTVPKESFTEPGTLFSFPPLSPPSLMGGDGEPCTDNCQAKAAAPRTVVGPAAMSGVVGDLQNGMVRVPNTQTFASAPASVASACGCATCPCSTTTTSIPATQTIPCGCSVCPCSAPPSPPPTTSCGCNSCPCASNHVFVAAAPPLPPIQSCGCSSCPCAAAIAQHQTSPCGCEECPCPAIQTPPPVCGCSVCPCPAASCGCAVCPCVGPLPYPHLLTPAQTLAIMRALGQSSPAPTLSTPACGSPSCMTPAERAAREQELKEEQARQEREAQRKKLHEEMFKHQANFNAISRLSRQLRFEYAQLKQQHLQIRSQMVNNRKTLAQLINEPADEYDIDGPSNSTKIEQTLDEDVRKQKKQLGSSHASQQQAICIFLGMDRKTCEQRALALQQASNAAANATMRFSELIPNFPREQTEEKQEEETESNKETETENDNEIERETPKQKHHQIHKRRNRRHHF